EKNKSPGAFTFPLEPGTTIRGSVVDDTGSPVSGATVKFEIERNKGASSRDPHVGTELYGASAKTDAAGKWSYDRMPEDVAAISLGAWHHQYASERGYWHTEPFPQVEKLRDGSAQLVL